MNLELKKRVEALEDSIADIKTMLAKALAKPKKPTPKPTPKSSPPASRYVDDGCHRRSGGGHC